MDHPTTWHRSVKRKLDQIHNPQLTSAAASSAGNYLSARVEVENEVFALREAVSSQQETIQDLFSDLEEERNAASSAASEAMSMILRLQREKAEIQMEFRQFKRFAEEKMAHDQEQLAELDDILFKREQALQSLSYQVKAYKHRLLSFGNISQELDQDHDDYGDYPPVKCMIPHGGGGSEIDDRRSQGLGSVLEKYSPTSLNQLQSRIYQMEAEKEEFKNGVQEEDEKEHYSDNESARVYTIDAIHEVANGEMNDDEGVGKGMRNGGEVRKEVMEDGDIQKLYVRLQVLEADRESMRQAIISMRTEKAQLVLLKEIAQQLVKDGVPERRVVVNKPSPLLKKSSFISLIKWVLSIIFWRKKASRTKYSFGFSNNNVGLMLLLDKSPRLNQWRCLSSTRS